MGLCCFNSGNLKDVIDPSKDVPSSPPTATPSEPSTVDITEPSTDAPSETPVNTLVQTVSEDKNDDMPPLINADEFPMDLEFYNFINNFETISCKTKRNNNRLYIKYQYMDKFLDFVVYTMNDKSFISVNKVSLELELFNSIYTIMSNNENSTTIIFKTGKDITIDCPSNIVIRALSDNFFNEYSEENDVDVEEVAAEVEEPVVEAEVEAEAEEEAEEEVKQEKVSKMIDNLFDSPNYTLIYFATILLFGLTVTSNTYKHPYDL